MTAMCHGLSHRSTVEETMGSWRVAISGSSEILGNRDATIDLPSTGILSQAMADGIGGSRPTRLCLENLLLKLFGMRTHSLTYPLRPCGRRWGHSDTHTLAHVAGTFGMHHHIMAHVLNLQSA